MERARFLKTSNATNSAHDRIARACLGVFYGISSITLLYLISWILVANGTIETPKIAAPEHVDQPIKPPADQPAAVATYSISHLGKHYPGFSKLEKLFVFGDSYSATGFDPKGEQPSKKNPLGNPDLPGATNTNGWNWVGYLVTEYNVTYLPAIDFAVGGATVDEMILQIGHIHGLTGLAKEIETEFLPLYTNTSNTWSPASSMFFLWIGINDIGNAEHDSQLQESMDRYTNLVDELYAAGARNFMFFYVPPIHRTPHAVREKVETKWHKWTDAWNTNITHLADNLRSTHPDVTTFLFDAYKLFNDAIDDPGQFPETASFKDTLGYCFGYIFGAVSWDTKDPNCDYAVNEYLWINDLHPTTVMHRLIAHEVAKALDVP